jgi:hypothetical protein
MPELEENAAALGMHCIRHQPPPILVLLGKAPWRVLRKPRASSEITVASAIINPAVARASYICAMRALGALVPGVARHRVRGAMKIRLGSVKRHHAGMATRPGHPLPLLNRPVGWHSTPCAFERAGGGRVPPLGVGVYPSRLAGGQRGRHPRPWELYRLPAGGMQTGLEITHDPGGENEYSLVEQSTHSQLSRASQASREDTGAPTGGGHTGGSADGVFMDEDGQQGGGGEEEEGGPGGLPPGDYEVGVVEGRGVWGVYPPPTWRSLEVTGPMERGVERVSPSLTGSMDTGGSRGYPPC